MSALSLVASAPITSPSVVHSQINTMRHEQCIKQCSDRYLFSDPERSALWLETCKDQCKDFAMAARALSTPMPTNATSFNATTTSKTSSITMDPAQEECMIACGTAHGETADGAACTWECYSGSRIEDEDFGGRLARDLSYAPSSTARYAITGPTTVTVTETWVHHDTVCSAAPVYATTQVKSTPASYALSTSKSIPASYPVKTSSHTPPRPVYPTAPVYKSSSTKSTPGYVAASSKSAPATYAMSTYKSTPPYYVSTPDNTTSKPHPAYPTGHYTHPITSAKYIPSSPQSMSDYTSLTSEASSIPAQPATNTTYNKPSAASSVPLYSETIISPGGASAYGISFGAVVLAIAALL